MTEEEWLQDSLQAMARIGARQMHDAALSEWCQTLVEHQIVRVELAENEN